MTELLDWLSGHGEALAWLGLASALMLVLSVLGLPWVLAALPADWFVRESAPSLEQHPFLRASLTLLRNVFGWLLVLAGLAMLVLPGQGLLTIFLGLALVDLPHKRRFERALLRRKGIRSAVDQLRRKRGAAPLILEDPEDDQPQGLSS